VETRLFKGNELIDDPGTASCFEQRIGADHIGFHEDTGVEDGPIHVRFSCKIDDRIDFVLVEKLVQQGAIGDVSVDKDVTFRIREIFEVLQAAGISQRVQVDDFYVQVLFAASSGRSLSR